MTDPFGLMQFAECEHKQLKCEQCGARSDIRGWSTFTGQNKEMMELREANESLTARLAEAEKALAERISLQQSLNEIYTIANLNAEVGRLRGLLREVREAATAQIASDTCAICGDDDDDNLDRCVRCKRRVCLGCLRVFRDDDDFDSGDFICDDCVEAKKAALETQKGGDHG